MLYMEAMAVGLICRTLWIITFRDARMKSSWQWTWKLILISAFANSTVILSIIDHITIFAELLFVPASLDTVLFSEKRRPKRVLTLFR